ncbi:MAG: M48 family metalloprotease [Methylotenera sp.]|nr:M48 family metalloprotease [Methylotenera sp.]
MSAQEVDTKAKLAQSPPATISNIYSDIDMRVRLATKPNAKACEGDSCAVNSTFDALVTELGGRLAVTAFKTYPDLKYRIKDFTFVVADKKEPGMASNGAGKIVLFRGIQNLELSEEAVSFILAREMGHVIGRHHNKNTSTKIIFSVLAGVLFPAVSLLSASNVAAQATTTAVTSIASTATSYIGSEVAISKIKPSQLIESDNIAIHLLDAQGWDMRSVESILQIEEAVTNGWLKDLHDTSRRLNSLIVREDMARDVDIKSMGNELKTAQ